MSELRGLILAAGRGRRLGRLTADRPKCLTRLGGHTLLEWQKMALNAAGLRDVALVTGYRSESLSAHSPVRFHNPGWASSNSVTSLQSAAPWLESGPVVVSYSDIVYHHRHVVRLLETGGDISLVSDRRWRELWELRFEDPFSDAESFGLAKGRLTDIGRKGCRPEEINGQYIGLLKLTTDGWAAVQAYLETLPETVVRSLEMTHLLMGLVSDGFEIEVAVVRGRWCEVDSPTDLKVYQQRIRAAETWSHDWRF